MPWSFQGLWIMTTSRIQHCLYLIFIQLLFHSFYPKKKFTNFSHNLIFADLNSNFLIFPWLFLILGFPHFSLSAGYPDRALQHHKWEIPCILQNLQYVPRIMHLFCSLLDFRTGRLYPYTSGLLDWHWGNHIAPAVGGIVQWKRSRELRFGEFAPESSAFFLVKKLRKWFHDIWSCLDILRPCTK